MLSPATARTFIFSGARFGNVIVQLLSVLASMTYVISVESPARFFPVTFHLPATSASVIAGGAGGGAGAPAGVMAAVVSAGLSALAQATIRSAREATAR